MPVDPQNSPESSGRKPSQRPIQGKAANGEEFQKLVPPRPVSQLPFLTALVLLESDSPQLSTLFSAFLRAEPPPALRRGVAAAVVQSHDPDIRLRAVETLLNDPLAKEIFPTVFAAYKAERNESIRREMHKLLLSADGSQLHELETYFEALRFTPQAKTSDLKIYGDEYCMRPHQVRRAQVIMLLDPDPDMRRMAACELYSSARELPPEIRQGLLCSVNSALREPLKHYEAVKSDVLFLAEKLWVHNGIPEARAHAISLVRPLFQSPDMKVASDAAVVSLSLHPEGLDAAEVLTHCLQDRQALATKFERAELTVRELPDIEREVEAMRRFVQSLLGPDNDTTAFDHLQYKIQRGQEQLLQKFEELLERRMDLLEKRVQRLDDWGREILVSRIACRLDGATPEQRSHLIQALFGVLDNKDETLRVRKAVLHNLSLNLKENATFLEKFIRVAVEKKYPEELRCWACRAIPRLERLSPEEMDCAIKILDGMSKIEDEALVEYEAELSVRKLKIFKAKPQLRFAMLFDANGNLRADAKEILRDVVNPDYDF